MPACPPCSTVARTRRSRRRLVHRCRPVARRPHGRRRHGGGRPLRCLGLAPRRRGWWRHGVGAGGGHERRPGPRPTPPRLLPQRSPPPAPSCSRHARPRPTCTAGSTPTTPASRRPARAWPGSRASDDVRPWPRSSRSIAPSPNSTSASPASRPVSTNSTRWRRPSRPTRGGRGGRGEGRGRARAELEARAALLSGKRKDLEVRNAGLIERQQFLERRLEETERRLEADQAARVEAATRRERIERDLGAATRLSEMVDAHRHVVESRLAEPARDPSSPERRGTCTRQRLDDLRRARTAAEKQLDEVRERARAPRSRTPRPGCVSRPQWRRSARDSTASRRRPRQPRCRRCPRASRPTPACGTWSASCA